MGVRREPLLLPVASLATGILIAHFFYFQPFDLAIPAALAIILLTITLVLKPHQCFRIILCSLCFALAGIATQAIHRPSHTPKMNAADGEVILLDGCVTNPPVFSPDREQFTLNLTTKAAARLTLNLKNGDKIALAYGQRAEVAAKIRSPRN